MWSDLAESVEVVEQPEKWSQAVGVVVGWVTDVAWEE